MKKSSLRNWRLNDLLISLGVLLFLLAYTYGILFIAPYPGFYFNPTNGEIFDIYDPEATALQAGDIIESVGGHSLDDFHADRNLNFFQGIEKGETIEITVLRGGQRLTVDWVYPGFTWVEFVTHFINIWWLAYVFWAIGAFTQLSMRPKDSRWRLFLAMNYLTAMFIMLGAVSGFQIMWSTTLLRVTAWLLMPVYLHFHWIFPTPLNPLPRWLLVLVYGVCTVFALGELFLLMPRTSYFLAVVLAFLGSILLLLCHYIFQRAHRREVRFLAIAAILSMVFASLIGIAGGTGNIPRSGPVALGALPILPVAYFYVLYWHRLGGLELRTNRRISIYLFLLLFGTMLLLILGNSDLIDIRPEAFVFATTMIAVFAAGFGLLAFPSFEALVERRLLGVRIPGQGLAENFSTRIVTSNSLSDLAKVLRDEVFPSLFIRQFAVIRNLNSSAQVMTSNGVTNDQVREDALTKWFALVSAGDPNLLSGINPPFEWVRLVLPLQVGPDIIGIWLLGRRDPDDHYPQAELPILRSLANQTGIALSNIVQTERLKAMYHANTNRHEEERNRLGRDLHDSVLNEMAAILIKHEELSQLPGFMESYDLLIQRLREIISDLRPPALTYGLKFALEALADTLSERYQDKIHIAAGIRMDGICRYPEAMENHLYRIVQEACENALKYSQANSITITGELREEGISLEVTDEGIGFNLESKLRLDDMLANKHFGLAGMLERADLIGAVVGINSMPGKGTQIRVAWGVK